MVRLKNLGMLWIWQNLINCAWEFGFDYKPMGLKGFRQEEHDLICV